ncbi:glutamine amidotransferase of anthranilate synthase [Fibrella aestuarina BUZ 2]|uniref:Glutamine amidotransferase of anthranilate synthase n=1 Tax=Fibrella aestuarina BUZ 2 TaxID=1166018 RepID=I0K2Z2_9BACT|nr:aminodeoxychorismate/anthranilate synthase component II [Fibrella aestuarina]CCG98495.1 glutamine amidotransferase of anthranilate synthase [Fibrella aestuarina BUZ 2]
MKLLVLDNYDSFTYNLVYILRELGLRPDVIRNDKISVEEVSAYDKILLSPGPGIPDEAGILKPLIAEYGPTKSIMGVCLGHQAIGEVFGATLENLGDVLHGVAHSARVLDHDEPLFADMPDDLTVGRYHSWSVVRDSLPTDLLVTAEDENGRVMGLRHARYDVRGVQFHPESVLTVGGVQMMKNWIKN